MRARPATRHRDKLTNIDDMKEGDEEGDGTGTKGPRHPALVIPDIELHLYRAQSYVLPP